MDEHYRITLTEWLQAYSKREDDLESDLEGLRTGILSKSASSILAETKDGYSSFQRAIRLNHLQVVKLFLDTLSPVQTIILSKITKDAYFSLSSFTFIQLAAHYNRHKILRDILNHVRAACISTLPLFLTSSNYDDTSAFSIAAAGDHWQVVECMLESLETPEDKLQLLSPSQKSKHTRLDLAVQFNRLQTVKVIVKHLNSNQLHQIMKINLHPLHPTTLHLAAYYGRAHIVKTLLEALTPRQRIDLLEFTNWSGTPPRLSALCKGKTETADQLESLRTTALIDFTKTASTDEDMNFVESLDLSSEEFKELSTLSSKYYIIPRKKGPVQQHAFIFYSAQNREGAQDEADLIEETFANIGFNISRQEWMNFLQFDDTIIESLKRIADKCSVVVVCIMAHGKAGMITGDNGTQLPINDILHQCTQVLPKAIPLVMIIQACQSIDTQSDDGSQPGLDASKANIPNALDASKASPEDNDHIDLVREHTLLVHATVMKGVAVRGALANALNRELLEESGNAEILATTTAAFGRLPAMQTPILLSTLKKRLVLSKIKNESKEAKVAVAAVSTATPKRQQNLSSFFPKQKKKKF